MRSIQFLVLTSILNLIHPLAIVAAENFWRDFSHESEFGSQMRHALNVTKQEAQVKWIEWKKSNPIRGCYLPNQEELEQLGIEKGHYLMSDKDAVWSGSGSATNARFDDFAFFRGHSFETPRYFRIAVRCGCSGVE